MDLAHAQVNVAVQRSRAEARTAEAEGESSYVRLTGEAVADRTRAVGLAEAKAIEAKGVAQATGYDAQTEALGSQATAIVAVANAVSEGHVKVVPDVLVTGGGGSLDGLAASLMKVLGTHDGDADHPIADMAKALEGAGATGKKATRSASPRRPQKPMPSTSEPRATAVPPPPPPEDA